jgi:hypothetical protein
MIAPYKITWQNLSSLDKDLWTELAFDSESGEASSFLSREAITTEHINGSYRRIHGHKYNEVITSRITLIKQDYSDFTHEQNRDILAWLTSTSKPGWLEVYHDDSEVVSYRLFGNWTEIEQYKLGNGRCVGYVCTFESSSPYAWSRQHTATESISETSEPFKIVCNSDEYGKVLYPKVTIKFKGRNPYFPINIDPVEDQTYSMVPNVIYVDANKDNILYVDLKSETDNGRYVIGHTTSQTPASSATTDYDYYYITDENLIKKTVANTVDGNSVYSWETVVEPSMAVKINNAYVLNGEEKTSETIVAGGVLNGEIVLDGTNKVISGINGSTVGDNFNWVWVPLAMGTNTLTVMGLCEITLDWIEPRKVGDL